MGHKLGENQRFFPHRFGLGNGILHIKFLSGGGGWTLHNLEIFVRKLIYKERETGRRAGRRENIKS